jgi:SagB-type dehydrogenase family enzyme
MEKYSEITEDELFSLSEMYHEKSKMRYLDYGLYVWITYVNTATEIRNIISKPNYKYTGFKKFPLSTNIDSNKSSKNFYEILTGRASVRNFEEKPLSFDSLSNILYLGNGVTHISDYPDGTSWAHRTTPSGGGLYPVEVYCVIQNVEGLEAGVYAFSPVENCLYLIYTDSRDSFFEKLSKAMGTVKDGLENSGAVIMLAPYMPRMKFKYKERAYRFVLLETGHIAQNLLLAAEAANLGAVPVGGFVDETLNEIIKADGLERSVMHCVLLGHKKAQ